MSISLQCAHCGRRSKIGEEHAGKKVRCRQCGEVTVVPSAAAPSLDIYDLDVPTPRNLPVAADEPLLGTRSQLGKGTLEKKKKKKAKTRGVRELLERVENLPGGRVVWRAACGAMALGLVFLAVTHLFQALVVLYAVGIFCLLASAGIALIASFQQGILAALGLATALILTLSFLGSLLLPMQGIKLGAAVSALISYSFFFSRAKQLELYRRAVMPGIVGLLIVVPPLLLPIFNHATHPMTPIAGPSPSIAQTHTSGGSAVPVVRDQVPIVPTLPEVGPGREFEPGITFHEILLPGGPFPGHSGKLWLYVPSGEHAPKTLPCVMIAAAGSNLMSGMALADGDRPEHLPYVRAGFAVLAYELDGMLSNQAQPGSGEATQAAARFRAARAGLVNAHIALEFLLKRVPQVDPDRVFTAGHSSAGGMALLFAEHEPRLKGCVAYSPAVDVAECLGPAVCLALRMAGHGDLTTRYSPRQNEARLNCPVFLFYALDELGIAISNAQGCADRLRQMGKAVTLETVPTGGHHDSMIQQGIPRAIPWLQNLARPSASRPTPASGPPPPLVPTSAGG